MRYLLQEINKWQIILIWSLPDDYEKPVIPDNKPLPLLELLALETLNAPEDKILWDWIDKVFSNILDYFNLKPAKGMSLEMTEMLAANVKTEKITYFK